MYDSTLCFVVANHGAVTTESPVSHGSIRIEKAPLEDVSCERDGCDSGENIRRKVLSAFRCLTVTDIAAAACFLEGPDKLTPVVSGFCFDTTIASFGDLVLGLSYK